MTIRLLKTDDSASRLENFRRLENFVRELPLVRGNFAFREFSFEAPTYPARVSIAHKLGFLPKDILITRQIGAAINWRYELFTGTTITVDVLVQATTVRGFFGAYAEGRLA